MSCSLVRGGALRRPAVPRRADMQEAAGGRKAPVLRAWPMPLLNGFRDVQQLHSPVAWLPRCCRALRQTRELKAMRPAHLQSPDLIRVSCICQTEIARVMCQS